jgi:tetratricopeptide (TPR) repeat protein
MTLTPIERRLEDTTVVYIKAQAWQASIGLFAQLARLEPDNANAWFGIGSALWRLSLDKPELLEPAVAALKRAVQENKQFTNKTYKQLLLSASQSADRAGIHAEGVQPFQGDPIAFLDTVQFTPQTLIDATRALPWEDRARVVLLLSDVPGALFETLLTDLAEHDDKSHVRAAAAKALRDRPQKPAPTPPPPLEVHPPEPLATAEPELQVTMVDEPTPVEVARTIPNTTEILPEALQAEARKAAAEAAAKDPLPQETPEPPLEAPAEPPKLDPAQQEAIRAQLEARRQRLMRKK